MDNMQTAAATPAVQTPAEMPQAKPAKKSEHWLVEVTGGVTLGSTMVAALSLWMVTVLNVFA